MKRAAKAALRLFRSHWRVALRAAPLSGRAALGRSNGTMAAAFNGPVLL
jgi:hypothetical protein